jgi:hypothetical protein
MSSKKLRSTSKDSLIFELSPDVGGNRLFWASDVPPLALHALALITPLDAAFSPLIANRGDRLVLETLEPLPGDRKCFRMINGVLAERTVKDVIPALRTTAEGLKKVLDDLVKQYKTKQDELDKWKKKNNVQVVQS